MFVIPWAGIKSEFLHYGCTVSIPLKKKVNLMLFLFLIIFQNYFIEKYYFEGDLPRANPAWKTA